MLHALRRFDAATREAASEGTEIWPWYLRAWFGASSALAQSADDSRVADGLDLVTRELRKLHSPDEVVSQAVQKENRRLPEGLPAALRPSGKKSFRISAGGKDISGFR